MRYMWNMGTMRDMVTLRYGYYVFLKQCYIIVNYGRTSASKCRNHSTICNGLWHKESKDCPPLPHSSAEADRAWSHFCGKIVLNLLQLSWYFGNLIGDKSRYLFHGEWFIIISKFWICLKLIKFILLYLHFQWFCFGCLYKF